MGVCVRVCVFIHTAVQFPAYPLNYLSRICIVVWPLLADDMWVVLAGSRFCGDIVEMEEDQAPNTDSSQTTGEHKVCEVR